MLKKPTVFVGWFLWGVVLAGQPPATVELLEPERISPRLSTAGFLTLDGAGCAVRFAPGALDRAHHLLRRLELVTFHLNRWNDVPVPTAVLLLTREEWRKAGLPGEYGVPIRVGPTTVISPAQGDSGTVALWTDLLGTSRLPMVFGTPLRGTAAEAATMALSDVFLQIETARGFVQRAGLLGSEAWIGELAAHTAALVVFKTHEKDRLPEIAATFERLGTRLAGSRALWSDFQPTLNLGTRAEVEKWLWFQARFHEGARIVLFKDGKGAVGKLQKMSKKGSGVLGRDELERRYPALRDWLASSFAP